MHTVEKYLYQLIVTAAIATLGIGTVVYHLAEHFSWVDAYYFSVITLTTVGYGDLSPHTTFGKIFTTFYVLIGIGIISVFISVSVRRHSEKFRARRKRRHNGS